MNTWTDPAHAYTKQDVSRIEGVLVYLYGDYDLSNPVSVNLVIVNKILTAIELPNGYHRHDFGDLKTDIELCLVEWHGFGKNEIDLGILL